MNFVILHEIPHEYYNHNRQFTYCIIGIANIRENKQNIIVSLSTIFIYKHVSYSFSVLMYTKHGIIYIEFTIIFTKRDHNEIGNMSLVLMIILNVKHWYNVSIHYNYMQLLKSKRFATHHYIITYKLYNNKWDLTMPSIYYQILILFVGKYCRINKTKQWFVGILSDLKEF